MAEIMKSSYFDDIRVAINEHKSVSKLLLPEDSSESFDYEANNFRAEPEQLAAKLLDIL